jgi:uncharacterized protein
VIVVADTSVLINLCCIDRAELLRVLFRDVFIPPEVEDEFRRLVERDRRFGSLTLPGWVRIQPATAIPDPVRANVALDIGEAAAISLALEMKADAILLDERHGYEAATELGLIVIGLLGVLLRAKRTGHIEAVAPEIDRLHRDAKFWISGAVRRRVLELAKELE